MPQIVPAFLLPTELDELQRLAEAPRAWTPGRQGTGYDISSLKNLAVPPAAAALPPAAAALPPAAASLAAAPTSAPAAPPGGASLAPPPTPAAPLPAITRALSHLGTPHEQLWDAYLIRYRDGAYVPPHIDPAEPGRRHRRLNAMLSQATGGGALRIGGALVALSPGDAVVFYSDQEVHEVTRVTGTRLLFSVGVWV